MGPASGKGPAWAGWGCKSKSGPKDSWPVMGIGTVEGAGVEEPSSSMFSASSMLSSCTLWMRSGPDHGDNQQGRTDRETPQVMLGDKGGGEDKKVVMGGRGLGRAGGWVRRMDWPLESSFQQSLVSCSHNGGPVVLNPGTRNCVGQCDDSGWCSST